MIFSRFLESRFGTPIAEKVRRDTGATSRPKFTRTAERVLEAAYAEARFNNGQVTPQHLALTVANQLNGAGREILGEFGIGPSKIRTPGIYKIGLPRQMEVHLDEDARDIIQQALAYAQQQGLRRVGTAQLVVGMASLTTLDSLWAQFGADRGSIRAAAVNTSGKER